MAGCWPGEAAAREMFQKYLKKYLHVLVAAGFSLRSFYQGFSQTLACGYILRT
jgi:hypothetical protein